MDTHLYVQNCVRPLFPRIADLCIYGTIALAIAGCGMLPSYRDAEREALGRPSRPLTIVGPDGALMTEHRAMIEQRLRSMGEDGLLARHLHILEAVSAAPLVVGNATDILIDGPQAYDAILKAIDEARDHVHIESFIFEELDFGRRLSDLLIAKERSGVAVSILYDSVGSLSTPRAFFDRLREAGIRVCEFNPVNPLRARMWRLNHRDHRKIVVVDGNMAFTGGINFHQVYRSGSMPLKMRRSMPTLDEGWRDTHLRIRGPAVRQFQELFLRSWEKQHCGALPGRRHFPPLGIAGDDIISVIGSSPDGMMSNNYLTLISAITYARKSIYMTAAYFAPDASTIMALEHAVARGVEVRLLLPGITDSWLALYAGRSHYSALLAAGVRIYERHDTVLHAKTAVIDGVWSTIGSSNVDWRSFYHNDEVNAVVLEEAFGARMTQVFFDDLAEAAEVIRADWEKRGAADRLREWFARRWEYLI